MNNSYENPQCAGRQGGGVVNGNELCLVFSNALWYRKVVYDRILKCIQARRHYNAGNRLERMSINLAKVFFSIRRLL